MYNISESEIGWWRDCRFRKWSTVEQAQSVSIPSKQCNISRMNKVELIYKLNTSNMQIFITFLVENY